MKLNSRTSLQNDIDNTVEHAHGTLEPSTIGLSQLIRQAVRSIYQLDRPTPVQEIHFPGLGKLTTKREDLSQIGSYKWRGAYFLMQQSCDAGFQGPFVAASAGNHAQGVAMAARKLNVQADIFMPITTPALKRSSVEQLGGDRVTIHLYGDTYDQSAQAAQEFQSRDNARFVSAFDDLEVIAGQATVAVELFRNAPNLKRVYVPIGGGGLASGVGFVAKEVLKSDCEIVGVEVENQDSMHQSLLSGKREHLQQINTFCDGTAVATPGQITFELCQKYLDRVIRVSNADVCWAIQACWDAGRFIPEPSGAVALAGIYQEYPRLGDLSGTAAIVTGCNMDFRTIPRVVRQIRRPNLNRRYFRFNIPERRGALIQLLDKFMSRLNIVDFQYGKCDSDIAHPVLGIEGPDFQLEQLVRSTQVDGCLTDDTSHQPLSQFRVIPFRADLCPSVILLQIDFPNRPGALRELMRRITGITNICFFDFVDSGESEGHGLIGFELIFDHSKKALLNELAELGLKFQVAQSNENTI